MAPAKGGRAVVLFSDSATSLGLFLLGLLGLGLLLAGLIRAHYRDHYLGGLMVVVGLLILSCGWLGAASQ